MADTTLVAILGSLKDCTLEYGKSLGIKLEERLGGGGVVRLGFLRREWDWEIGVSDAI